MTDKLALYAPLINKIQANINFLNNQGIPCQFTIINVTDVGKNQTFGPKLTKKNCRVIAGP
jgi:hypothetical protein